MAFLLIWHFVATKPECRCQECVQYRHHTAAVGEQGGAPVVA
jgi:hypothetical protein